MTKVKITCFADEISQDLEEQLDVLESEGVKHLEIRNLWGKNVLDLSPEELNRIRETIVKRGFAVSSIGSPIGKYQIADAFDPQLDALQRANSAAHALGTPYIRIFSFHPPKGEELDACRDEVLRRMEQLTQLAKQNKTVLILENDNNLYGSKHDRCLDILQHNSSPALRMAFDPGNFVRDGVKPMTDAYPLLQNYVDYVHIKDATPTAFVPAGAGEGQIPELLLELKQKRFDGFLSVEPHLHHYLPYSSNPKRVATAVRALKQLLADAEMDWE